MVSNAGCTSGEILLVNEADCTRQWTVLGGRPVRLVRDRANVARTPAQRRFPTARAVDLAWRTIHMLSTDQMSAPFYSSGWRTIHTLFTSPIGAPLFSSGVQSIRYPPIR